MSTFTFTIECELDYEEPNPTAFPGAQGESVTLEHIVLPGAAIPARDLPPSFRRAVERAAMDYLKQQRKENES